jgi:hypothetical protein
MAIKILLQTSQKLMKRLFLLVNLLSLLGCATIGANLALDLAKEEEAKGCVASDPGDGL